MLLPRSGGCPSNEEAAFDFGSPTTADTVLLSSTEAQFGGSVNTDGMNDITNNFGVLSMMEPPDEATVENLLEGLRESIKDG